MKVVPPGSVIGIIGGGQLEKMTALAAAHLGYTTHILSPDTDCPAAPVSARLIKADYRDEKKLQEFAEDVDIITYEFENIPRETVAFLEKISAIHPAATVLEIAQHRAREKAYFRENGVATTDFAVVHSAQELAEAFIRMGNRKAILKSTRFGYDGKGQVTIASAADCDVAWARMGNGEALLEAFVPFEKEISAIIARGRDGSAMPFPVAENTHRNGILDTSMVPAGVPHAIAEKARNITLELAQNLGVVGLLTVEFFVLKDGTLLANEMAPRPHNSGHWTLDGCVTSQFEQLVRSICGLPLGSTALKASVTMKNLLGRDVERWEECAKTPYAKIYIYGKKDLKPGRKTGHVNMILPPDSDKK